MRMTYENQTNHVVESDGSDDQGVFFSAASGVAVPGRIRIGGMRAAVHKDRAVRVRPTDIENVHPSEFREIRKFHTVGCHELPRRSGWFAARMRLHFILTTILEQCFGPGLEGRLRI